MSFSPIIIEPGRSVRHYWSDLWRYRELFYIFSWRDIKVRYKQTVLGIAWALLRPLLTMLVFTYIFGRLAKMPVDGIAPYSIMVFAGLLPWQFFSNSLSESSSSLVNNQSLLTKIYFPRLILPASAIVTCFVDFIISFLILALLFVYYNYLPPAQVFLLPVFFILLVLAVVGPGVYLTAMNVKYRDFRYIIPFIIQFGLFISPVGFSSNIIQEEWKWLYYLNPMAGIIDGFRYCIIHSAPNPFNSIYFFISMGVILLLLLISFVVFRRMERTFADTI